MEQQGCEVGWLEGWIAGMLECSDLIEKSEHGTFRGLLGTMMCGLFFLPGMCLMTGRRQPSTT